MSVDGVIALQRVARWLEAGAPHVDVNGREIDAFDMTKGIERADCGTACCIAGALVQFDNDPATEFTGYWSDVLDDARRISGITNAEDASELFGLDDSAFYANERRFRGVKPEQAAKVIRHFIRTGVVDWNRVGV